MKCKTCKKDAIVRVSKSQKNMGKEFYACPDACQGWIGWVDENLNVPKAPKEYIQKPPAVPMSDTNPNEYYINEDGEVGCKACGKTCTIRKSNSEKNSGKEYYACQDFCNIWNGWVEEEDEAKPKQAVKQQAVKQQSVQQQKQPTVKQPTAVKKTTITKQTVPSKKPNLLPEEF